MSAPAATARRAQVVLDELRKVPAFFRRDLLTQWSYRTAFLSDWASLVLQVALFAFIGRIVAADRLPSFAGAQTTYIEYVAVGLALSSFLYVGITRAVTVMRNEQMMGTLESLMATPTSPITVQLGSIAYDLVYVPLRTGGFLLLTYVLFDARFAGTGLLPAAAVVLAFIPFVWGIGLLGASWTVVFRRGLGVVGAGTTLMTLTSNAYFPVEVLPGWLEVLARFNPMTVAVDATREAILGGSGWEAVAPAVGTLLAASSLTLGLGVSAFVATLAFERRRGTLGLY